MSLILFFSRARAQVREKTAEAEKDVEQRGRPGAAEGSSASLNSLSLSLSLNEENLSYPPALPPVTVSFPASTSPSPAKCLAAFATSSTSAMPHSPASAFRNARP